MAFKDTDLLKIQNKMKKITFICSLLFIVLVSCTQSGNSDGSSNNNTDDPIIEQVETPVFTPVGSFDTFSSDQLITISTETENSTIYYDTTRYSTPTINSIKYTGPILITPDSDFSSISAFAIKDGYKDSNVASSLNYWVLYPRSANPTIVTNGLDFSIDQEIELTCSTPNSEIHYTIDGTIPTENSLLYSTPIKSDIENSLLNIRAISTGAKLTNSSVVNQYKIRYVITGSASTVSITLRNSTGGTEQYSDIKLPKTYNYTSFPDDFVYISAQNMSDSGNITVQIYQNCSLYKTSTASGAYVIATASGSN